MVHDMCARNKYSDHALWIFRMSQEFSVRFFFFLQTMMTISNDDEFDDR